jgi:hypothetical protein
MGRRLRNFRIVSLTVMAVLKQTQRDTIYMTMVVGERWKTSVSIYNPREDRGSYDSTSEDAIRVHDLLLGLLVVC